MSGGGEGCKKFILVPLGTITCVTRPFLEAPGYATRVAIQYFYEAPNYFLRGALA